MRLLSCLLVILAATSARGDDPQPAPTPSPVRAKLDAATAVRERALAELTRGYDEIKAANLSGPTKEAREAVVDERCDAATAPALDELLDAADQHPGDPDAVEALAFVALNGRGLTTGAAERALATLLRDHVRAANISTATRALFVHDERPGAIALLRAVLLDNPSRVERGRACNDLAFALDFQADQVARRRAAGKPIAAHLADLDATSLRAEAEALYERGAAEFADVPVIGYGAGKTVGDFARGVLFDRRHLQVGQPAPEIVGVDVDGKPLRLSHYRGRVVVLVFSGEWCGPCRANAPFFRALLTPEAQRAAPCVVLEVNTDRTREPVRKAIAAGEIAWPCWFDGDVTGPITLAWGVESFPTIHVIDAAGVIRARDVDCKDVAAVVARVLAEHPPEDRP